MPYTKITWVFTQSSFKGTSSTAQPIRTWGWSESWYAPQDVTSTELKSICDVWMQRRAALLGVGGTILGYRMQRLDPIGATRSFRNPIGGSTGLFVAEASLGLLFYPTASGAPNRRQVILRGLPDARAVQGEYNPVGTFNTAIGDFWGLVVANFSMKGKVLTTPTVAIDNITATTGIVTTKADHAYVVNQYVQILRSSTLEGRQRGGTYLVTAVADARHFTIQNWQWPATRNGRARLVVAPTIFPVSIEESQLTNPIVVKRDTGRPSAPSRGRQPARH